MGATKIAWTDESWNVITGCSKVSAGCRNCYAERHVPRLIKSAGHRYYNGFKPTCHEDLLYKPFKWVKPRRVFVSSMGDPFHEDVPFDFLYHVFAVMELSEAHTFQMLTKRPDRMAEFAEDYGFWPDNVWAGVTIEHNDYVGRADVLRSVAAAVKFISAEPLLGPLTDLDLSGIDQLIVGGESGPKWRPMDVDWARDLRDRCQAEGVAFFFKQYSALRPKTLGKKLDGQVWEQYPKPRPNAIAS